MQVQALFIDTDLHKRVNEKKFTQLKDVHVHKECKTDFRLISVQKTQNIEHDASATMLILPQAKPNTFK
jgi:hypothetical protein